MDIDLQAPDLAGVTLYSLATDEDNGILLSLCRIQGDDGNASLREVVKAIKRKAFPGRYAE